MKKQVALLLCAVVAAFTFSTPAIAAEGITASQAKATAEKQAPAGSKYLKTEKDDGKYEVSFYLESNLERYDIEVSVATGKILSYESKLTNHGGSKVVTLTSEAAQKKLTKELPKAEILSTRIDSDDGYQAYEVRFRTDTYYGEYTIHPENGNILERDIRVGAMPASKDASGLITHAKASALALKEVPNSIITDIDLDYDNGSYVYEIELYKSDKEYNITLDAKTGKVLSNRSHKDDWDQAWSSSGNTGSTGNAGASGTSGNYISAEKAKEIALARASGAVVKECKLDYEDGRAVYEGELRNGSVEYEFEIDAITGAFIKWETDFDD